MDKFQEYASPALRYGMTIVFFFFAFMQFSEPGNWTGYLPEFLANTSNPTIFIYANAIFEVIFGILLALGIWTRIAALLLGLHLLAITVTIGFTPTGIRDFGLTIATLSIAMRGADELCLENKWKKK